MRVSSWRLENIKRSQTPTDDAAEEKTGTKALAADVPNAGFMILRCLLWSSPVLVTVAVVAVLAGRAFIYAGI